MSGSWSGAEKKEKRRKVKKKARRCPPRQDGAPVLVFYTVPVCNPYTPPALPLRRVALYAWPNACPSGPASAAPAHPLPLPGPVGSAGTQARRSTRARAKARPVVPTAAVTQSQTWHFRFPAPARPARVSLRPVAPRVACGWPAVVLGRPTRMCSFI